MRRYIVNPPVVEPLGLSEAKRWLRIDHSDDDLLIEGLVRAARERVEARTGRALLAQTWRIVLDQWPGDGQISLPVMPVMPVISVVAVRVANATGLFDVIASSSYSLDARLDPAILTMREIIPPHRLRGGIEIDVVAGYGLNQQDCPESLRQAIFLMIGEAYSRRGPDQSVLQKAPVNSEIEKLIMPYSSIRLGHMAMRAYSEGASR